MGRERKRFLRWEKEAWEVMSHAPFLVAVQAGCGSGFNAISALAFGLVSDFHLTRQVAKPRLTAPPSLPPRPSQGITLVALLHV